MSDPTIDLRAWALEQAIYFPLSPAELYMLLLLAFEPEWEETPPEMRRWAVGQWFNVRGGRAQTDLLNLQQLALGDLEADRRGALRGAGR